MKDPSLRLFCSSFTTLKEKRGSIPAAPTTGLMKKKKKKKIEEEKEEEEEGEKKKEEEGSSSSSRVTRSSFRSVHTRGGAPERHVS